MDDELLIETLLYKGEGTTLDYKEQQYPHDGATPDIKGELLKDIIAFANAWRNENAYILIGVSNSGEIVGLDKDLDDSRLQQFICNKTNTPIHFSYRSVKYKGFKLGLYTIEVQERPFFAKQQYGKVQPDIVYVRRGSSTTIAKPDEIAKMGAEQVTKAEKHAPNLSLRLLGTDDIALNPLSFDYKNVIVDNQENLPDLVKDRAPLDRFGIAAMPSFEHVNRNYYRELASYLQQLEGIIGFRLELTNTGTNFAADVRIYLEIPVGENLQLIEECEILCRPKKQHSLIDVHHHKNLSLVNLSRRGVSITTTQESTTAVFNIGKIQSGETLSTDFVYLVRPPESLKSINIRILSDQLREPLDIEYPLIINEQKVHCSLNDLKRV